MTSSEMQHYIDVRHGELCDDEIRYVTDVSHHPQINHIIYDNGIWSMWDTNGTHFSFRKRVRR